MSLNFTKTEFIFLHIKNKGYCPHKTVILLETKLNGQLESKHHNKALTFFSFSIFMHSQFLQSCN